MARQTIEIKKKTTITIRPKTREELSQLRSANAKKQKRGKNGRFV